MESLANSVIGLKANRFIILIYQHCGTSVVEKVTILKNKSDQDKQLVAKKVNQEYYRCHTCNCDVYTLQFSSDGSTEKEYITTFYYIIPFPSKFHLEMCQKHFAYPPNRDAKTSSSILLFISNKIILRYTEKRQKFRQGHNFHRKIWTLLPKMAEISVNHVTDGLDLVNEY